QQLAANEPIARGDLGLVLWQSNRGAEARPHLVAALSAVPSWSEVALAAGELALAARDYAGAAETLGVAAKCEEHAFEFTIGKSDNFCARAKHDLALALIG